MDFEMEDVPVCDVIYQPTEKAKYNAHLSSFDEYKKLYDESIRDPESFWKKMAHETLSWDIPFQKVSSGSFQDANIKWFEDGYLNACYNCVDRHANKNPNKVAIYWEGDQTSESRSISYLEMKNEICRLANYLESIGVKKGDCVAIYMPMIPEAVYAMLACVRIGAIHSVVFGGFSDEALKDRIIDAKCRVVITADEGVRGGKVIHLKNIVDQAIESVEFVKTVLVVKRTGEPSIQMKADRDVWYHEKVSTQSKDHKPVSMNSEDLLFILYTSGSTGKPKGVAHSTAGYLLYASLTFKYVFNYAENDIFGCMADVGWITGHSYVVYGPLCNGATIVLFDSTPFYPDASRYWQVVDKALRKAGDAFPLKYDLSSLRVLGSVGEPINPEAWQWYYDKIGRNKCALVDTYWQTETGGIVITPISSVTPTKPGAATLPFFGIEPALLDPHSGHEISGNGVCGVLAIKSPWPSITRTVYGDHERYKMTYFTQYPGYYFTGDSAARDSNGYYWIRGRVDDVINVSGHRLSTAEIENALINYPECAEAAVIGKPDEITGQSICVFCILRNPNIDKEKAKTDIIKQVRKSIGPIATPKSVYLVPDLPKTRSGKIMRRLLRKIVSGETNFGDLTTLSDPSIINKINIIVSQ
ncbi:AMP-dependent synthetase/ligase domain-containing protein [Rozella allomycis CSF55]|uniref:Acetyl-coenzyme A synthetase n=1 Tax=Rozella allomycis (strain CSF55) TaxID=988480 RepID=A0A075B0L9_ROZAC|nr:AMP-dependent synthetase/ligase domain-containing protein [Rozella allomycis CSF55]|eukprot:EPZ36079.1 AMP-dependent synthetase/ligase domain-containing protein [Rozella allomycis CSF55]